MNKFFGIQAFGRGAIIRLNVKVTLAEARALVVNYPNMTAVHAGMDTVCLEGYVPSSDMRSFNLDRAQMLAKRDLKKAQDAYDGICRTIWQETADTDLPF